MKVFFFQIGERNLLLLGLNRRCLLRENRHRRGPKHNGRTASRKDSMHIDTPHVSADIENAR